MYSIAQIIYGIPLVTNGEDPLVIPAIERADEEDEIFDDEDLGFLSYYSGSADQIPRAFGVELGQFDEACAYIDFSSLPLTPTEEQLANYQALLSAVSEEIRAELLSIGEPRVFLLWSTS